MINNYKSIRAIRAEAIGSGLMLGRPVIIFLEEDEVEINSISQFGFSTNPIEDWFAGSNWSVVNGEAVAATSSALFRMNGVGLLKDGTNYQAIVTVTAYTSGTLNAYAGGLQTSLGVTGTGTFTVVLTAANTQSFFGLNASSFIGTVSSVEFYEVIDHTYKLMARSDDIPAAPTSTSGLMNSLLPPASASAFGNGWDVSKDAIVFNLGSGTDMTTGTTANTFVASGATYAVHSSYANGYGKLINTGSAQGYVSLGFDSVVGHKYILSVEVVEGDNSNVDISLSSSTSWNTGAQNLDNNTGEGVVTPEFTADDTTSFLLIRNTSSVSGEFSYTDNVRVYGVYGYDSFVVPSYRSGLISNIWDATNGRLKSSSAVGDKLEVILQGETTTSASNNDSETIEDVITKIITTGQVTGEVVAESNLPNSLGVVTASTSGTNEVPIILFQGVEFSESFVHKNSLIANAKCSEAITRFRPVSLYLDSSGDLICMHDDIPNEAIPSDRDYLSASPGKWGVSELGGATGDIIPVTVAGVTTINTSSSLTKGNIIKQINADGTMSDGSPLNNFVPNGLGTVMESGTGDIGIIIFRGTPIGTINNWKRTIKITATAQQSVTQYCPVSIYVDGFGNYKCTSDDIPNNETDEYNAVWVDNRRWGIAQDSVSSGEKVEIIVQGRTKVVDTLDSAARTQFITKISSAGVVTSLGSSVVALTSLGIVETEAKSSTSIPGTIIIF